MTKKEYLDRWNEYANQMNGASKRKDGDSNSNNSNKEAQSPSQRFAPVATPSYFSLSRERNSNTIFLRNDHSFIDKVLNYIVKIWRSLKRVNLTIWNKITFTK